MTARITEAGRVDSASLFARFAFTRDELVAATDHWLIARRLAPAPKPDEVRTFTHELVHYLQYVTTPYGLFLHYCRLLQNGATVATVRALLAGGCPVRQPLLYSLPAMPPDVEEEVYSAMALWLNVENLVAALAGDTDRRLAINEWYVDDMSRVERGGLPLRPPLLPLPETLARVWTTMANVIDVENDEARKRGQSPVFPDNLDRPAIEEAVHAFPTDLDRSFARTDFVLAVMGNPLNVEAIVEGHATAAEFMDTDIGYDELRQWAATRGPAELDPYRLALLRGLDAIHTSEAPRALASFMTLCEVALSPPVLPQHAGLRKAVGAFDQLLPVARFVNLLSAAGRMEPMRNWSDQTRYVTALCSFLGWVQPATLTASAMQGPQVVTDPMSSLYLRAQRWRVDVSPSAFVDVNWSLVDPSPAGIVWRRNFSFVIIDYADRTTYHRDKDFLESMTTRHLEWLGLQAVMESNNLTLRAPYGHDSIENAWMTKWLRARFRSLFHQDFPDLTVV